MRGRAAYESASQARSMSSGVVRHSAAMIARRRVENSYPLAHSCLSLLNGLSKILLKENQQKYGLLSDGSRIIAWALRACIVYNIYVLISNIYRVRSRYV